MIRFLQIGRRKAATSASHFALTLERVRDMREHSEWEPLTAPSTIRQRADRIAEAREHIKVPPLAHQRETPQDVKQYFRTADFWRPILYPIAGIAALGLALCVFISERAMTPQVRQSSIVFPTAAYTNLTESVAERFARRALLSAVLEPGAWRRLDRYRLDDTIVITFHHQGSRFTILRVTVKLEPGERIVCTIDPQ